MFSSKLSEQSMSMYASMKKKTRIRKTYANAMTRKMARSASEEDEKDDKWDKRYDNRGDYYANAAEILLDSLLSGRTGLRFRNPVPFTMRLSFLITGTCPTDYIHYQNRSAKGLGSDISSKAYLAKDINRSTFIQLERRFRSSSKVC